MSLHGLLDAVTEDPVKSVGYWAGFPVVAVITGDVIHTINSGDTP
ncbi:hypothetical protein ABZ630_33785 [Streptomyces albidoflavus]